jgi:hypothetical protein
MTVYDVATAITALGRNIQLPSEMDTVLSDAGTVELGRRPFNTLFGQWSSGQNVGFGINISTNLVMVIEYTLTITEEAAYEFDADADDYIDLFLDGTGVCYSVHNGVPERTQITLAPGTYTLTARVQNGTGEYDFAIRWRKLPDTVYTEIPTSVTGLPEHTQMHSPEEIIVPGIFPDYPHKLTIKTVLDSTYVQRRVEIRNSTNGKYIASMITDRYGVAAFKRLLVQRIDEPHIVTVFDDRKTGFLNALVHARVFQVSDQGFPPEN